MLGMEKQRKRRRDSLHLRRNLGNIAMETELFGIYRGNGPPQLGHGLGRHGTGSDGWTR